MSPTPLKGSRVLFFDCTKYSMDAFTGKEQNRANVVSICSFNYIYPNRLGLS